MAVGSSIVGSLGTSALLSRIPVGPAAKDILKKVGPFIGVVLAN
jgi:hypothetical protein